MKDTSWSSDLSPTSDFQIAQELLREAFILAHQQLSPREQYLLFQFACELVAREGRWHWGRLA
jgi:hypothetical protein